MPIHVLIGPAGSGKTGRVLNIFKQFTPSEHLRSVRFILPTLSQVLQIRSLILSDSEFTGLLGDPICTFYEFARDFLIRSGLAYPKPVTEIQRLGMFKKIIANTPGYFDGIRDCPNFPDVLGSAISSLKNSGIEPENLRKAAESGSIAGNSKRKILDLAALYQAYEDELAAESMHDRDDVILRALEAARENPESLRTYECIILDGFSTFTPVQQELIRLFAEHCGQVTAVMDCEEDRPEVFSAIEPSVQFLTELPGALVEQVLKERKDSALAHLGRQIFCPDAPKVEPDESVAVLVGSTTAGEIELVTEEIKRLTRKRGFSFADIAVVARSIGPYRQNIQSFFRQYGIPLDACIYPLAESRPAREILQHPRENSVKAVEKLISGFKWTEDEQALQESCAAWKALRGIAADITALGVSHRTFAEMLKSAIRTREYRVSGSPDGVALLDINMLRGRKFRVVFIVGMLGRTFPRQVREDPLINDSERRALNPHLPYALRLREQDGAYERYLFYTAVASAQNHLYLCHPLSDSPSCFLRESDRLFTKDIKRLTRDIVPPIDQAETAESLLAGTLLDCCNSRDGERQAVAASAYNLLLEKGRLSADVFDRLNKDETSESDEAIEVTE